MDLAAAQMALGLEGFTMFDRPSSEGTSFDKEVVVCLVPLGAIATLFVKRGTVDGRDVETLIRNRWRPANG